MNLLEYLIFLNYNMKSFVKTIFRYKSADINKINKLFKLKND